MSMLSEPRQKQKWSLNPRGKWWTEDPNKFGQRMLEKMGWTKGKGLGVNEQGIAEFSSVLYKNDTTGVGYDKNFEAWTKEQEKFSNLLQQLNGNQNQDTVKSGDANLSGQSIELKSKDSRARMHYKKFTRGKDINKYNSKDLANILGQKELVVKTEIKVKQDDGIRKMESADLKGKDNWYGVVTINSGNMVDYFKSKHNTADRLKCNVESNHDTNLSSSTTDHRTTKSESENEYAGFGFTKTEDTSQSSCGTSQDCDDKSVYAFDNPCLGLNRSTETPCDTNGSPAKSAKKRKKRFESDSLSTEMDKHNIGKKLKTEAIDSDCKNGFINPALNLNAEPEEDCNGKEFEVFREQIGLENCGLDLTDERNDKKRVTFNDHVMLYEYNINSAKKKKGEVTLDKFEVENKKSKKKRKHESTVTSVTNGFINEALDIQICEEINDNELNKHRNKKIKKRKICKTSNLETIQESPEKEIIQINVESEEITSIVENGKMDIVEQKSKKKKKKIEKAEKKVKQEDITVLHIINEETDTKIEETSKSKKTKKNKDSKVEEEEMSIFKKCKKKKKKDKENCKSEKHTGQTEINNKQQDIKMLDKSDLKQQNNYLIENKNKDAAIVEPLSVFTTKENEKKEEPLEKIKHKKKKRKSINNEDPSNQIDISTVEREICDKENTDKEQDPDTKKLAKKEKKSKKSKDETISNLEDSSLNKDIVDVNVAKQDKIENAEFTGTPSKKDKAIDIIDNIISSPWSAKARMSKKMLITLFHNNAISDFPGSNIRNIKGYGADDYDD
ncbi:PREDICTED: uncharacterized protein PF11_0213-like [Vollenhovia emeryi]|uniref:uncharacterized protein PF11_0213-like n=1 Tax=Vollenhovia emeryi TaxID=411798 RepID=UPI0005F38382|nr:PREDICTED: uncharacterized protein PF11_0213-like [Vollenhovia emeryi]